MNLAEEKPFVHLHLHSEYSVLDGCASIKNIVNEAKRLNMPAVALTDHGNMFGAMDFYSTAKKVGVKPLIGCEIYLVVDHKMEERPKRNRNVDDDLTDVETICENLKPSDFPKNQVHHKTLIAKNFTGYQNLCKINSLAHTQGFYYKPRIDIETLAKYSEGIMALSGCLYGVASQYLLYSDFEKARYYTEQFIDIFGKENYFIEIQNHALPAQKVIYPRLINLAKDLNLPIVATNDVHYVKKTDATAHDAMLCINTQAMLSDEKRMRYPNNEFYMKNYGQMAEIFPQEALDNTVHLASMCDIEIKFGENHYPKFEAPIEIAEKKQESSYGDIVNFKRILQKYVDKKNELLHRKDKNAPLFSLSQKDEDELAQNGLYLFELCKEGLVQRYNTEYKNPETLEENSREKFLCEKLEYELSIIVGAGFTDYFLIVNDFIAWARANGIPVGPGRGSGAGCMIAYLIKITDIDPIRFGLLFERMLSLERISPPDFDVDFCERRRDEVIDYVRQKYGQDRVANIITFGTFGPKMIVRDLARINSLPASQGDKIAKMIPDELKITFDEALKKSVELADYAKNEPIVSSIIKEGKVLESMVRNTGKHACGIIIGDQPLTNIVPLTKQKGHLTIQYPKYPAEALGLLKADFLGLKTLTVISDAQKFIRQTNPSFDIEKISLDDKPTFDLLNSGQTVAVFQLESAGMQSLCKQIGLSQFEEIIALIALYRPGPMQFIPDFIKSKKDPSLIKTIHPLITDILSETYGIIVYQEQVMQAAQLIAGYSLGDADILRRAMGKKNMELMLEQKKLFVQRAGQVNNIDEKQSSDIFEILLKFAQYGFNKSHSAAYAMLSYRTAYLKANYPTEFMAAVLSCELGNPDKLMNFIEEAARMKIEIKGPDINKSGHSFTPIVTEKKPSILFGLGAIKGIGESAVNSIISEIANDGQYKGVLDFLKRTDSRVTNKRVVENLIKTGAFDKFGFDRAHLLQNLDSLMTEASSFQKDKQAGQFNLFESGEKSDVYNGDKIIKTTGPKMNKTLALSSEKELLGFYLSGHPLQKFAPIDEALNHIESQKAASLSRDCVFRICGVVSKIEKRYTKKDNKPWAFFTLSTRSGKSYQINLFSNYYEELKDSIKEELPAIVIGEQRYDADRQEMRFNCTSLISLEDNSGQEIATIASYVKKLKWIVKYEKGVENFINELSHYIHYNKGMIQNELYFDMSGEEYLKFKLPESMGVKYDNKIIQNLKKSIHFKALKIETVSVPKKQKNFYRQKNWKN